MVVKEKIEEKTHGTKEYGYENFAIGHAWTK